MRITILKGALHICREIDIHRWPNGSDTHVGAKGKEEMGRCNLTCLDARTELQWQCMFPETNFSVASIDNSSAGMWMYREPVAPE